MKKLLTLAITLAASLTLWADTLPYFSFVTSAGKVYSLTAVGLEITFSGSNLVATNATTGETRTIALADLDKMYFSASDITTGVTAADGTPAARISVRGGRLFVAAAEGSSVAVVDMSGITVASTTLSTAAETAVTQPLRSGIYLVKINETTTKIAVK